MKHITKAELVFALTKYYERAAEFPEEFGECGNPADDAQAVANILFETVEHINQ